MKLALITSVILGLVGGGSYYWYWNASEGFLISPSTKNKCTEEIRRVYKYPLQVEFKGWQKQQIEGYFKANKSFKAERVTVVALAPNGYGMYNPTTWTCDETSPRKYDEILDAWVSVNTISFYNALGLDYRKPDSSNTTELKQEVSRTIENPSPNTTKVLQNVTTFQFPMDTCGDPSTEGSDTWYPVFVDFSEKQLSEIKTKYCRDAIAHFRKEIGKQSIQVASFTSDAKAEELAGLLKTEFGSGEVGKPTVYQYKSTPAILSTPDSYSSVQTPYGSCPERAEIYQSRYQQSQNTSDLVCLQKSIERELSGTQRFDCPLTSQNYQNAYKQNSNASDLVCMQQALERELR